MKSEGHIYTVQLRFVGDQLDPADISERLNLMPSHTSDQMRGKSLKTRGRPFWAYNGKGEDGYRDDWLYLEDALDFLLGKLNPKKSEIIAIAAQFNAVWWCGHFQKSFNGGPILSAKTLAELGSYGISLSIDNYLSTEE